MLKNMHTIAGTAGSHQSPSCALPYSPLLLFLQATPMPGFHLVKQKGSRSCRMFIYLGTSARLPKLSFVSTDSKTSTWVHHMLHILLAPQLLLTHFSWRGWLGQQQVKLLPHYTCYTSTCSLHLQTGAATHAFLDPSFFSSFLQAAAHRAAAR